MCALGRRSLVLLLLRLSHPTGLHAWLPYALGPPPLEALLPPTTPAATWASRSTVGQVTGGPCIVPACGACPLLLSFRYCRLHG